MNQITNEGGKLPATTLSVELTYDRHACLDKAIDLTTRQALDVSDVDQEALRGASVRQFDLTYASDSEEAPAEANVRGAALWLRQHDLVATADMVLTAERAKDGEPAELRLIVDIPLCALPVLSGEMLLSSATTDGLESQGNPAPQWTLAPSLLAKSEGWNIFDCAGGDLGRSLARLPNRRPGSVEGSVGIRSTGTDGRRRGLEACDGGRRSSSRGSSRIRSHD